MRVSSVLLALLLAGCASYTPKPLELDTVQSALIHPAARVLEQKAGSIDRPWLAPVTVDLSAPLTPDAISALAVANNPDLVAMRARADVAGAQVFAAGLLPDPTFSVGTNKVLSGPDTMLDLSGALGLDINALRTRAVRREAAVAQNQQVRLDLAWAEWQTAGQARIQGVRVRRLEDFVSLARQARDTAQSLQKRISRAAARGDIAGDRLQAARLAVASANDGLRNAESGLAAARVKLRRLLGLPPDYPLALADPVSPPMPPTLEVLFALAQDNRTDLAALRQGYATQEAAVHQAVLEQFPNLGLTLNSQRDSAGNLLIGPAVDFTLPLWNRNRGTIAVERATREALRAEYDARLFQTRADIAAAQAGISISQNAITEARAVIPRLESFATASRRAADRGDLSLELAKNAEQALRDRLMQLVQAGQDYEEQMIALELLTGTPRGAWPQ